MISQRTSTKKIKRRRKTGGGGEAGQEQKRRCVGRSGYCECFSGSVLAGCCEEWERSNQQVYCRRNSSPCKARSVAFSTHEPRERQKPYLISLFQDCTVIQWFPHICTSVSCFMCICSFLFLYYFIFYSYIIWYIINLYYFLLCSLLSRINSAKTCCLNLLFDY